jgi:hypothetical protein
MKRTVTLLCVFLTLAAAVYAQEDGRRPVRDAALGTGTVPLKHDGKIETNYDGFNHETVVALKRMVVTCEAVRGLQSALKGVCVSLQASLHCPGKQLDHVRRATIRLTFEAKNWDSRHPAGERELSAVADGETVRLGRMTLVSQGVSEGWFDADNKETLEVSVPYESFLKLARATYVQFSVGKTTFAMREKNIAALRDMRNRVKLPPPAAVGPAPAGGN